MSLSLQSFLASIRSGDRPPLPMPLRALWLDARGDWAGAHKCVDMRQDKDSCWVHAYLHRKEGDLWNARYWYARAGRPPREGPLEEEWREIAAALLADAA
ncbi:hypothetical protein ACNHKD_01110 [Methylocystis sp. JAN1]|uniref:hypothetical protein n=1 Tax=Methylocystis sp. JAN1 TaxID=3397211 RepID=UPI003FA29749